MIAKNLAAIAALSAGAFAWRLTRGVLSGTHPVAMLAAVSAAAFAAAVVLAAIGGAMALAGRRESEGICTAAKVAGVAGMAAGFWPAIAIAMV